MALEFTRSWIRYLDFFFCSVLWHTNAFVLFNARSFLGIELYFHLFDIYVIIDIIYSILPFLKLNNISNDR